MTLATAIADTSPSAERLTHDPVERVSRQIADVHGIAGWPWRALTILERWERAGQISAEQRQAGEHFQGRFHAAAHDPLKAADMARVGGGKGAMHHSGSVAAQRDITKALDALGGLGSPQGSGVWLVIGCELSIREWSAREAWKGRPLHHERAKRILVDGLAVLVKHYGY